MKILRANVHATTLIRSDLSTRDDPKVQFRKNCAFNFRLCDYVSMACDSE